MKLLRLAPALLPSLLLTGCFSVSAPDGKYHCEDAVDCLDGFTCFEGYCCRKDRLTGLCVDHPCLVNGADEDRDGFPLCADDCNDDDATTYPGAPELCDGRDNNCDLTIDEGATLPRFRDADGDGHGSKRPEDAVLVCADGPDVSKVSDDCDDADPAIFGGAAELCDQKDNDCDGSIDEDVAKVWYRDDDGDGYGQTPVTVEACEKPDGYAAQNGDCQDQSPLIHPGREEVCNDFDDDCDGNVDEGVKQTFYPDNDKDGFGAGTSGVTSCSAPVGYAANQADCNDGDALIRPGVAERCNGADDDCDAVIDEGVVPTWYRDADGDTWGTANITLAACQQPAGHVERSGDCNDAALMVNPSAQESCNAVDDDCDGLTDEALTQPVFRDVDGDGYGNPAQTLQACGTPTGYVGNPLDCDDTRSNTWPGAPEHCDGVDNDCDGVKDNANKCGPKVDQAEVAGAWGAGNNALGVAAATVSGCIAGTVNHSAQTPLANTSQKTTGASSISASTTNGMDFYLYFPEQRNAAWDLRRQKLHFDVAGTATTWTTAYRQPVVLFCAWNGTWARYEPAVHSVGASFSTFEVTVPLNVTPGGGFTYSASFSWQNVDWIELHANPASPNNASLLVDDFRFITP